MLSNRDWFVLGFIAMANFMYFPSAFWYFYVFPLSVLILLLWIIVLLKRLSPPEKKKEEVPEPIVV